MNRKGNTDKIPPGAKVLAKGKGTYKRGIQRKTLPEEKVLTTGKGKYKRNTQGYHTC